MRGDNSPASIAGETALWSAALPASASALAEGMSQGMFSAHVAPPWWGGSQAGNGCGEHTILTFLPSQLQISVDTATRERWAVGKSADN